MTPKFQDWTMRITAQNLCCIKLNALVNDEWWLKGRESCKFTACKRVNAMFRRPSCTLTCHWLAPVPFGLDIISSQLRSTAPHQIGHFDISTQQPDTNVDRRRSPLDDIKVQFMSINRLHCSLSRLTGLITVHLQLLSSASFELKAESRANRIGNSSVW